MTKPPCSEWSIWVGKEIEGNTELGVTTLFIRAIPSVSADPTKDFSFMTKLGESEITRVWFCKEFTNWALLEAIARHFKSVCIEVTPERLICIPQRFRERYQIYVKVSFGRLNLKKGDVICVGPAFADEAFTIGEGAKVQPDLYLNDLKIL